MSDFVHLHVHSDFSILDGMGTIKEYVRICKELGMNALALTDHGNMHGAIKFYRECKKAGINPIVGCEFYHCTDREIKDPNDKYNHLILLAMDKEGYDELLKLQKIAWIDGKYYKPRIDDRALIEHSSHLICLSACISGEIQKWILRGNMEKAEERVLWFKNVFGDRFYLEIQNHGLPDELKILPIMMELAKKYDVKLVATNDVHYAEKSDSEIHDTLICIGTQRTKYDYERIRYKEGEFYFRSEEEMLALFPFCKEAVYNTAEVANRCRLDLTLPGPILPRCPIPIEFSSDTQYLKYLAYQGLEKRYPNADESFRKELEERLEHELDIIDRMGFSAYFLIVADYVTWAKEHDISVGPGRGSGAGSLVAYTIRITDIDPIRYGLIFERFLNPERVSMPDFDVDFCYERRGEVIDYVTKKYGIDHVGQIATFTSLKPKAVLKDVARVFGLSVYESNELSSLIPDSIPEKNDVTLKDSIECVEELQEKLKDPRYKKVFEHAVALEGLKRHTSLHPAGIVIGKETLDEYVPLMTDKDGIVASQVSSPTIEECGLVKMDILGLKTLTLIRHTEELIRLNHPKIGFDIEKVPEDDKKTYRLLAKGDSECVFQFESPGMQNILVDAKPSSIDELAALNALYRPGPLQFIDQYIDSKFGRCEIKYPDPCLEPILKSTYGVIVFQEQVMKVAQRIAGYTLGEADELRRIMGKKKIDKMAAELEKFKAGAVKNGFSAEHAEEIFHILEPFAGYGFNKSHAVAYAILAYRTAYLKAHYPVEFMAANLTNEAGNADKFKSYLALCKKYGITIELPSINKAVKDFSVSGNNIVFGLSAIKGMGDGITNEILKEREKNGKYEGLVDFVARQKNPIGEKTLETLVKCGCFDEFSIDRATMIDNVKRLVKADRKFRAAMERDKNDDSQLSLFEFAIEDFGFEFTEPEKKLERFELLSFEREYLGAYISGHPLEEYQHIIDTCVNVDLSNKDTWKQRCNMYVVGRIKSWEPKISKKGNLFAHLVIETPEAEKTIVVFKELTEKLSKDPLIVPGNVVGIKGYFQKGLNEKLEFRIWDVVKPSLLPSLIKR